MADDALLSDLCSICNIAKFKYRCPGCSARTCSLPCYKRHQQWQQCNGKRDPTKFVKKSQLATPAGIDHDYNFLTGIERDLQKAEKQAETHGVGIRSDPRRGGQQRQAADSIFGAAGVNVIRAPQGLSRQKENKTHRSNKRKGHIIWTVEWIHEDTTRILTQTSSAAPILSAQPFTKVTKKRKRDPNQSELDNQDASPLVKTEQEISGVEVPDVRPESSAASGAEPERVDVGATTENASARGTTTAEDAQVETASHHHRSLGFYGAESESVSSKYAFYLLRPRTSSNRHVLIPLLDPTVTLADCLRGRTVLEFPTIYAFPLASTPPSDKFMLEAEYLQQDGKDHKDFEDLMRNISPETLGALKEEQGPDRNAGDEIDSDKILDVLKRDIGAGL